MPFCRFCHALAQLCVLGIFHLFGSMDKDTSYLHTCLFIDSKRFMFVQKPEMHIL